jgi:TonB family protein
MRLRLLAAATILASSLFAADPELVSLAMPDTQVMAGVNVEQALLSPLGQFLKTQPGLLPEKDLQKLIETTGFDPRRDLREILVSLNKVPADKSGIILARGTFDVPRILAASENTGATTDTYKGVPVILRAARGCLAFPNSTLAILGSEADVHAAIDRISAPTAINSALAVQVNQLSTTEDAWFVSMAPLSQFQPQAPGAGGPMAMIGKVLQASGGVKFGANVVVSLQAVSATDQDAATLAAGLKALMGVAQMAGSKGEMAQAAALLQGLNITADGPVTKISLSVPEQQVEQMILAAHAGDTHTENAPQPRVRSMPRSQPQSAGGSTGGQTPQRIRVGREVQKAKLVLQAAPVYPPLATQARISGVVRLNVIIGKDGTVQNITVSSGHPLLVPAALDAVKQWVYQPTLLNGQPVEVVTQVEVNFSLEP